MAVLAVELMFPSAPITSLQKRIAKGIEQFYYAKLFLTNPVYKGPKIWGDWLDLGFHVAIYSPPPGTRGADRIRVRLRAPSRTPVVSVEGSNTDALEDLESLLRVIDGIRSSLAGKGDDARASALRHGGFGKLLVEPTLQTLEREGFEASVVDEYLRMLRRGFDALTDSQITASDMILSVS